MSSFKTLEPKDNFYQTSLFFPMPVVMIGTLAENGQTSLGPYSLLAPYYIAGKGYYAMLLECRNSSNTAQNLLRTGKCTINFIPDDKKYFKEAVRMGWPGDTTAEKMKNCLFTFENGVMASEHPDEKYPQVVKESFQAIECTWMKELDHAENDKPGELNGYPEPYHDFNGITSKFGAHFILRIDKILMKEKSYNTIVNGVTAKGFPRVPVDYGYRDSKNFWCARFKKPRPELLPMRETSLSSVRYAAERLQTDVKFTDEALGMLVKVPRIFLPTVLKGCVKWANEHGVKLITPKEMQIINDKRAKEKGKDK
jgi:flavin reductase (DIM6/NTAB) family NADH-FMN oxidoreductase RutF